MTARFPILAELDSRALTWADLMYVESRAIIGTTVALMERGIPALPVHDSLVIPASQIELTIRLLAEAYEREAGITPALSVLAT